MQLLKPHKLRVLIGNSQAGFSLILFVIALAIGFGALLGFALGRSQARIERDNITEDALARAKQALIEYAAADYNRVLDGTSSRGRGYPLPRSLDIPGVNHATPLSGR